MTERNQLEQYIKTLEAQRAILGNDVVDASIRALREKIAASAAEMRPAQQRKLATILFADISGFTALAEKMDAEDIGDTMNALWQRLDGVVTAHGGIVDKHIGDAIMALWGAITAREDDPEQAIRAALAMQAELKAFCEAQAVNLAMRVGLNTGHVLLGEVGTTAEFTALGDTVNTASRLEHAAPVGGVLISHDTYQHVRGIFDVQPLPPLQVKGKTEPLQVYVVERAKGRAFHMRRRGVEGIETRMIGRETELKQLQDALHGVLKNGKRQIITIIGEAGIGKSRLLYEFDNRLELMPETLRYFKGRASLELQNVPYALVRDLFAFRFQIQDSDPARVVRKKMEQGIGDVLNKADQGQMKSHFIGQWLGFDFSDSPHLQGVLDDARQIHDRALIYLGDFFRATTSGIPSVIFLENIHWADDSSLDTLNFLATVVSERPLLMVCLTRPTLFEKRPDWGKGQVFHHYLELKPLSSGDSHSLVAEILQKVQDVPDELSELIVRGAEGNPFYVEELIKMLIEDEAIVMGEDSWQVALSRLNQIRVPPTLTGVLQARLDSLPSAERAVLQQASVVGRAFWDSAIAYLGISTNESIRRSPLSERPGQNESEIQTTLSALRDKEMVFRRKTSAFIGAQEHIFKHAIMREVTYESVLKRVRRTYHGLIAEWLINQSGERANEYMGLIADHLELAGQTERAIDYLRQAGEQAAAQYANAEAVGYLSRALDLMPENDTVGRFGVLLFREKVNSLRGMLAPCAQDLDTLTTLADRLDDDQCRIEVALRQANYALTSSDYPLAIVTAQRAITLAEAAGADASEAAGYISWGTALLRQAEYSEARVQLDHALTLAQQARLPVVEIRCLLQLNIVARYQGDIAIAQSLADRALRLSQENGERRLENKALNSLGSIAWSQGDYDRARGYYQRTLSFNREIGDRISEGTTLDNLGVFAREQGDYVEARSLHEQALPLRRESGYQMGEMYSLGNLGVVSLLLGDYEMAYHYLEQVLRFFRETNHRLGTSETLAHLGLLAHNEGDDEAAQLYCQEALSIASQVEAQWYEQGHALTVLGHSLARTGRLAEATDAYRQALNLRRSLGQHNQAMEALAGLASVSLSQNDLIQAKVYSEEILQHLETTVLDGAYEPFRIYLTCYRVFYANKDARAQTILNKAYTLLRQRAAKINDEALQRLFLENIDVHREIITAWEDTSQQ